MRGLRSEESRPGKEKAYREAECGDEPHELSVWAADRGRRAFFEYGTPPFKLLQRQLRVGGSTENRRLTVPSCLPTEVIWLGSAGALFKSNHKGFPNAESKIHYTRIYCNTPILCASCRCIVNSSSSGASSGVLNEAL